MNDITMKATEQTNRTERSNERPNQFILLIAHSDTAHTNGYFIAIIMMIIFILRFTTSNLGMIFIRLLTLNSFDIRISYPSPSHILSRINIILNNLGYPLWMSYLSHCANHISLAYCVWCCRCCLSSNVHVCVYVCACALGQTSVWFGNQLRSPLWGHPTHIRTHRGE